MTRLVKIIRNSDGSKTLIYDDGTRRIQFPTNNTEVQLGDVFFLVQGDSNRAIGPEARGTGNGDAQSSIRRTGRRREVVRRNPRQRRADRRSDSVPPSGEELQTAIMRIEEELRREPMATNRYSELQVVRAQLAALARTQQRDEAAVAVVQPRTQEGWRQWIEEKNRPSISGVSSEITHESMGDRVSRELGALEGSPLAGSVYGIARGPLFNADHRTGMVYSEWARLIESGLPLLGSSNPAVPRDPNYFLPHDFYLPESRSPVHRDNQGSERERGISSGPPTHVDRGLAVQRPVSPSTSAHALPGRGTSPVSRPSPTRPQRPSQGIARMRSRMREVADATDELIEPRHSAQPAPQAVSQSRGSADVEVQRRTAGTTVVGSVGSRSSTRAYVPKRIRDWLNRNFVDHVLAHLWGPGFGADVHAGLMAAPRRFNSVQNKTIEEIIRNLRTETGNLDAEVFVRASVEDFGTRTTQGRLIPRNTLRVVEYRISALYPDGSETLPIRVSLELAPPILNGSKWRPDPRGRVEIEIDAGSGRPVRRTISLEDLPGG